MTETFYGAGALDTPPAFLAALLVGAAFGACLERAGFGSSRKLCGIFYFRDMTVLKVMFTGVVTAMLGVTYLTGLGWLSWDSLFLMPSVFGAQVVGGLLFGVGFVMGGWCPGTAAVGVASGKLDAVLFLGGATAGSILYNELYDVVAPLAAWGASGAGFAYDALGLSRGAFGLLFTLVAVAAFWAAEVAERVAGGEGRWLNTPFLRAFSVVLVTLAFGGLALGPGGASAPAAAAAPAPEAALLTAVAAAEDHVEPEDLADRLLRADPTLLVVDVRPAEEYAAFHLRGAVNVQLPGLPAALEPHRADRDVVLYSNGMTHPAQARDALARLGFTRVYLLTDGLEGFKERCLKPASLRDGPVPPAAAARIRAWRAFFLEGAPPAAAQTTPPAVPADAGVPLGALLEDRSGIKLPGVVDVRWLGANLARSDVKVVDFRKQPEWNGKHIPGSLSLAPESLRGNRGGVPSMLHDAATLAHLFGEMGLRPDDLVVFVPGEKFHDATLGAVACERLGHRRYALLNGGFPAWVAAGLPTDAAMPRVTAVAYPVPPAVDDGTVDAAQVQALLEQGAAAIDARPPDHYSGATTEEARGGHVPGAVNRPVGADLVGKDVLALQGVSDLAEVYAALSPDKAKPVVVYCRTGHQGSQTAFVLRRLLGYRDVRYYDGGWTDWAARGDLPVAR